MAKKKSLKSMSLSKLVEKSDQLEEKLTQLKLKHSQGKLKDTAGLGKTKRELARVNTFINQKAKQVNNE